MNDKKLQIYKTELDTDPLTRGYASMTSEQVCTDMNTLYRDAPASRAALLDYMLCNEFRNSPIYGRVQMVANAAFNAVGELGTLPMGGTGAQVQMTRQHVAAAHSLLRLVDTDADIATPLTHATLDNMLSDLGAAKAGCFGAPDRAAMLALSQNKQSRASEIGVGRARVGEVERARNP